MGPSLLISDAAGRVGKVGFGVAAQFDSSRLRQCTAAAAAAAAAADYCCSSNATRNTAVSALSQHTLLRIRLQTRSPIVAERERGRFLTIFLQTASVLG